MGPLRNKWYQMFMQQWVSVLQMTYSEGRRVAAAEWLPQLSSEQKKGLTPTN